MSDLPSFLCCLLLVFLLWLLNYHFHSEAAVKRLRRLIYIESMQAQFETSVFSFSLDNQYK